MKTITAGIAKATGSKTSVFICAGSYAEHVKITSAVSLHGGFACADWSYSAANKPKVAPSDSGYALDVESVSSAITIADLELDTPDGKSAGESSIAAFVNESNVTFARATISAGAGETGVNGTLTPLTYPDQSMLNGNSATGGTPGSEKDFTCPGDAGTTVGGSGGGSGFPGDAGAPAADGGAGGTGTTCVSGLGSDGAPGSPGANGSGAAASGSLTATGWSPSAGGNGQVGRCGQGGGGGAGFLGNAGGSGGAGGCGGAGGGGGTGGGASVAVVSFNSTITLTASTVTTNSAGNGGSGAASQTGQSPAGLHGNGTSCQGGNGGPGGSGGAGGGGAGGVSSGVLYKGSAPTMDAETQISNGSAGIKGAGGISGTNDGVDGAASATLEIK